MKGNKVALLGSAFLLLTASSALAVDTQRDLLVHFNCEQKLVGGVINSASPGQNKGQLFGEVTRVAGRVGQGACHFEGNGPAYTPGTTIPGGKISYIRVNNRLDDPKRSLNVGYGSDAEFTLATWYRITTTTEESNDQSPLIEWGDPTDPSSTGVHLWAYVKAGQWAGQGTGTNLVDVTGNDSSFVISTSDQSRGEWHHLVVTYKRTATTGEAQVYVDGTLRNTRTFNSLAGTPPPMPKTIDDVYIGRRPTDYQRLQGDLDDIRIYRRALAAEDIFKLYNLR